MSKNNVRIEQRVLNSDFYSEQHGALLSSIYAMRGIQHEQDLVKSLKHLIPFEKMKDLQDAAEFVADFIVRQEKIVVVGDFDADGATSTALLIAFLRDIGHENCDFIIPNRFEMGYGLSNPLIDHVMDTMSPKLLITVDNGITSLDEIQYAKSKGLAVVVTDHHMPSEAGLPNADFLINPNIEDNPFPSKNLAGVGVAFYLTIALRAALRHREYFSSHGLEDINLAQYLDLVALGTVADMVELDVNNRILVHQGLLRIRNGYCRPGIAALLAVSQKDATILTAADLGYAIGPRLNAAGRISDMSIGVACLLTETFEQADLMAEKLHDLNLERREIELEMQNSAQKSIDTIIANNQDAQLPVALCLYDESWHQGVSGIIASRLKDAFKRPVAIFSDAHIAQKNQDEEVDPETAQKALEIKGSVRSIKGLDIRQILANIHHEHPDLILKFGGHKGAAGLTLLRAQFEVFQAAFVAEVEKFLSQEQCFELMYVDAELDVSQINIETAELIRNGGPWGMGFPEPVFVGQFNIMEQRIVGQRHLKLALQPKNGYEIINAICFNIDLDVWPSAECSSVRAVYRLDITEYRGATTLQLIILHLEKENITEEVGITEF